MQDHNSPDNYPTDDNNNNDNDNNNDNYSTDNNNYPSDDNDNDSHNLAWGQYFIFGNQFDAGKSLTSFVRPVRAF